MKTLGQIAYEAHVGDFDPLTQECCVKWDDLLPHVRSHWDIIAHTVVNTFRQRAILR